MCRFGKSPRTLFKPRFCNSFSGCPEGAESVDASCCVRTLQRFLRKAKRRSEAEAELKKALTRTKAEEYRRQAQEYLELARKISLERDRAVLHDMAQNSLRLAEEQEAQEEITPPPAVEQPQPVAQQQQQVQPKDDDKKE
jgi:hypothetical protein